MSRLNVDQLGGQTTSNIEVISGNTLKVGVIEESSTNNGVQIDGVLIKDGEVDGVDVSSLTASPYKKNIIINGNFDIWQRGTSFTGTKYTADRWYVIASGTGTTTTSQQSFTLGQTDVPSEPKYYLRIAKSSGATSGDYLSSKNESVRTFAGQASVISFYAKASAATTLTPTIRQNFGTGGSPSSVNDAVKSDISVTTSWQKFTITHTFDSISGKTLGTDGNDHIELFFNIQNAAGDSIDFAQFQWEKGSVATDFEIKPIAEELALCQRYYYKTFAPETTPAQNVAADNYVLVLRYTGAGSVSTSQQHPVQMAFSPDITTFNPYAANSSARQTNSSTDRALTLISQNRNKLYFYWAGVDIHSVHLHWTAEAEL